MIKVELETVKNLKVFRENPLYSDSIWQKSPCIRILCDIFEVIGVVIRSLLFKHYCYQGEKR